MHFPAQNLAQVAVSLLFSSVAVNAATAGRRATTCNGFSELCDRSYGNVSFVGAHDSYAVGTNNLFVNQDYDVTQQLNDGIRMLQMQVHNLSGVPELCHTSCALFDGGTLEAYLGKVQTWMTANPNDVVTLLIVNSDGFTPAEFDTVFKAANLDTISYSPSASSLEASAWPTLGSMIDAGTRLVTFLDTHADFTSVTYLIDEFTNVWETAYDVTDTTFNCEVNRTKGDSSTQMYLINHFLDELILGQPAPDVDDAATTNAVSGVGSLGVQVSTCLATNTRPPNFMLVDFYEYGGGSVFEVAASNNDVTYSPTSAIATPLTSSTSTSSSSNSNGARPSSPLGQQWATSLLVIVGVMLGACTAI